MTGRIAVYAAVILFLTPQGHSAEPRDHVLRVAATDVPAALGNPYKSIGGTPGSVWDVLFDCLTAFDDTGSVAQALAVRWENVAPTTWRFYLRQGATFSNGKAVDANAVVKSIEILKANPAYALSGEVVTIARASAIDPLTVEIVTNRPDAILPRRMSLVRIVEPETWAKLGPDAFAVSPVGSGPYKLENWGQSSGTLVLVANPNSWRAPRDAARVEVLTLKDATTRVQALVSGRVDVALSLNPDDMTTLKDAGFKIYIHHAGQIQVWALPNRRKADSPLNDVRVRQAINYAVNRQQIAATLLNGVADPASEGATPGTFGYDPELKPYPYDLDRARALLKEAGYPQGFPLIVDVLVGLGPADAQIHQQAAQDLGKIGIRVELRTTPYAARPGKYYGGQWGDVDAFSTTWNGGLYRDAIRTAEDFACTKPNPFFCDTEITALVARNPTIMDAAVREKELRQIMKLYRDRAAALWLTEYNSIIGLSPRVLNFKARPTGIVLEQINLASGATR